MKKGAAPQTAGVPRPGVAFGPEPPPPQAPQDGAEAPLRRSTRAAAAVTTSRLRTSRSSSHKYSHRGLKALLFKFDMLEDSTLWANFIHQPFGLPRDFRIALEHVTLTGFLRLPVSKIDTQQLFAFLSAVAQPGIPVGAAISALRALIHLQNTTHTGASSFPRLMPLLDAEVRASFARLRRSQEMLRAEDELLGPALRPPSALSMIELPSDENVARRIGLEAISMHAIEHDAFLASCGAGPQSLLHFALHTCCCDSCRTRSIPHLTVKAQHDTHRAATATANAAAKLAGKRQAPLEPAYVYRAPVASQAALHTESIDVALRTAALPQLQALVSTTICEHLDVFLAAVRCTLAARSLLPPGTVDPVLTAEDTALMRYVAGRDASSLARHLAPYLRDILLEWLGVPCDASLDATKSFDHAIVGDWLGLMTHAGANVANLENSVSVVYAHEALAALDMTPGAALLEAAGWPETYGARAPGGAASAASGTSLVPAPSYVAPDVKQIVHGLRFATKEDAALVRADYLAAPELCLAGPYSFADVDSFLNPEGAALRALIAGGGRLAVPADSCAAVSAPSADTPAGTAFTLQDIALKAQSVPIAAAGAPASASPKSAPRLVALLVGVTAAGTEASDGPFVRALAPWPAMRIASYGGPGAVLGSLHSLGTTPALAVSAYSELDRVLRRVPPGTLESVARGLRMPESPWLSHADGLARAALAILAGTGHLVRLTVPPPPHSTRVTVVGVWDVPSLATVALAIDIPHLVAAEALLRSGSGSSTARGNHGRAQAGGSGGGGAAAALVLSAVTAVLALTRLVDQDSSDACCASIHESLSSPLLLPEHAAGLQRVLAALVAAGAAAAAAASSPAQSSCRMDDGISESAAVAADCIPARSSASTALAPALVWSQVAAAAGLCGAPGLASGLGLPWTGGRSQWRDIAQQVTGAVDWSTPRQVSIFAAFPENLQLAQVHAAALGVLRPPPGLSSWLDSSPILCSSANLRNAAPRDVVRAGLAYSGARFEVGARLANEYVTRIFSSVPITNHDFHHEHPTMEHHRLSPHQPLLVAQPWLVLRQLQAACLAAHLFGIGPRPPAGTAADPYPDALRAVPAASIVIEFNLPVVPLGSLVTWMVNELSARQIAVVHHLYRTLTPLQWIHSLRKELREQTLVPSGGASLCGGAAAAHAPSPAAGGVTGAEHAAAAAAATPAAVSPVASAHPTTAGSHESLLQASRERRKLALRAVLARGIPPLSHDARWRTQLPTATATAASAAAIARALQVMDVDAAAALELRLRASDPIRAYPSGIYAAALREVVMTRSELFALAPHLREFSGCAVVLLTHTDAVRVSNVAYARAYESAVTKVAAALTKGGSPPDLARQNAPILLPAAPVPFVPAYRPCRVLCTSTYGHWHSTTRVDASDTELFHGDTSAVLLCQCGGMSCYRLQRELRGVSSHSPGTLLGPEGDAFLGHLVRVSWPPLDTILSRRNVLCVNEAFTNPIAVNDLMWLAGLEVDRLDAIDAQPGVLTGNELASHARARRANNEAWAQASMMRGWQRSALMSTPVPGQKPLFQTDHRARTAVLPLPWALLAAAWDADTTLAVTQLLEGAAALAAVRSPTGIVAGLLAAPGGAPASAAEPCRPPQVPLLSACMASGDSFADPASPLPCSHCAPALHAAAVAAAALPFGSNNRRGGAAGGVCLSASGSGALSPLLDVLRQQLALTEALGYAGTATLTGRGYDVALQLHSQPWATTFDQLRVEIGDNLVALPFGRCTSAQALSTLHALKTPCTFASRGPAPSPCIASVGHGASMRQPFQPLLRYSPDAGNYCGVRNSLTTDPLLSAEYVAYGGAGAAGLWLHPDTVKLLAAVVAGDKAALAAATAMSQMLFARGTVHTSTFLASIEDRSSLVDVARAAVLECNAAHRALREGRLACDAANLAAETSLAGAKRKFSEPLAETTASDPLSAIDAAMPVTAASPPGTASSSPRPGSQLVVRAALLASLPQTGSYGKGGAHNYARRARAAAARQSAQAGSSAAMACGSAAAAMSVPAPTGHNGASTALASLPAPLQISDAVAASVSAPPLPSSSDADSGMAVLCTGASHMDLRESLTAEELAAAAGFALPTTVAGQLFAYSTTASPFDVVFGDQHILMAAAAEALAREVGGQQAPASAPLGDVPASIPAVASASSAPSPGLRSVPPREDLLALAHRFTPAVLVALRACNGGLTPAESPLAVLRNQLYVNAITCGPGITLDYSAPYPAADRALVSVTSALGDEAFLEVLHHLRALRMTDFSLLPSCLQDELAGDGINYAPARDTVLSSVSAWGAGGSRSLALPPDAPADKTIEAVQLKLRQAPEAFLAAFDSALAREAAHRVARCCCRPRAGCVCATVRGRYEDATGADIRSAVADAAAFAVADADDASDSDEDGELFDDEDERSADAEAEGVDRGDDGVSSDDGIPRDESGRRRGCSTALPDEADGVVVSDEALRHPRSDARGGAASAVPASAAAAPAQPPRGSSAKVQPPTVAGTLNAAGRPVRASALLGMRVRRAGELASAGLDGLIGEADSDKESDGQGSDRGRPPPVADAEGSEGDDGSSGGSSEDDWEGAALDGSDDEDLLIAEGGAGGGAVSSEPRVARASKSGARARGSKRQRSADPGAGAAPETGAGPPRDPTQRWSSLWAGDLQTPHCGICGTAYPGGDWAAAPDHLAGSHPDVWAHIEATGGLGSDTCMGCQCGFASYTKRQGGTWDPGNRRKHGLCHTAEGAAILAAKAVAFVCGLDGCAKTFSKQCHLDRHQESALHRAVPYFCPLTAEHCPHAPCAHARGGVALLGRGALDLHLHGFHKGHTGIAGGLALSYADLVLYRL